MSMLKGGGLVQGGVVLQGASAGLAVSVEAVQSRASHVAAAGGASAREAQRHQADVARSGAVMSKTAKDSNGIREASPSTHEHRAGGRRLSYDVQVGVATRHRLFVGLTANISSGGLFVATDEELQRGDRVEVRFRIPGSDHVFHKQAEVAWIRPMDESLTDATQQCGAGVRLLDLTEDEKRMLNAFIDVHDPIFFDL